jgi:hypothetical protein
VKLPARLQFGVVPARCEVFGHQTLQAVTELLGLFARHPAAVLAAALDEVVSVQPVLRFGDGLLVVVDGILWEHLARPGRVARRSLVAAGRAGPPSSGRRDLTRSFQSLQMP